MNQSISHMYVWTAQNNGNYTRDHLEFDALSKSLWAHLILSFVQDNIIDK